MKKNISGQKIGAQMIAPDGTAFTSSVTCYVTVDAGTQATGTVGSGACTHEGHGYHTYAPSQAETNGDLIAYTFDGSGCVPVTVQVNTSIVTGDAYARLGAPAGASVSADIAATVALLPTALVGGRMDASLGAYQSGKAPLQPTVAGRTLDVSAGGEAGLDMANVGSPTSTVNLSGTTIGAATAVTALTSAMPDSIPSNGVAASPIQALYMMIQFILERVISGQTYTIKKPNHSTVLFTCTTNDATSPTSITRGT